jgi:hypothetical protein
MNKKKEKKKQPKKDEVWVNQILIERNASTYLVFDSNLTTNQSTINYIEKSKALPLHNFLNFF